MDPRLLNPYHDDLFESNFVKCQPQSQFWSDDVESLETQLVDGILPTTPMDVTSNNIFNNFIFKEENYSPKNLLTSNNNSISNEVCEDRKHYNEHFLSQEKTELNDGSLNSLDDIYNFNDNDNYNYNDYDYDSDTESDTESDTDSQSKNVDNEDDNISCMTSSFRSRTDSSSIGDYESHSSDYDDDDDDEPIKINQQLDEIATPQSEINEIKTVKEDVDPFAMQLDVATFDLAAFITEDDQVLDNSHVNNATKVQKPTMPIIVENDTDSDSDAIVDVETVDNEEIISCNQGQTLRLDETLVNKKIDLPWNSNNHNVEKKQIKSKSMPSGKRVGMGRGKNLKMFDNAPEPTNKQKQNGNIEKIVKENLIENEVATESKLNSQDVLVSHQTSNAFPTKRKLNLEEYKKRRENLSLPPSLRKTDNIVQSKEIIKSDCCLQQTPKQTKPILTNPTPTKCTINKSSKNTEVTSIVKSLKENQSNKQIVDPITEAKNKVLRLQELKKAQHIKIIESTVSRKVGRVTKLPPLKDIVKDTYKKSIKDDAASVVNNSEYEEIVIVSVGCNTDENHLSNEQNIVKQNPPENATRSLLKCNNMTNSFPNVRSDENVKRSGNAPLSIEKTDSESIISEHGEDKIIMHLRKDRIRKPCVSQCTQTDDNVEQFTSSVSKVRRKYRSRRRSYSSDRKTDEMRYREMSKRRKSRSKYSRRRYRSSISSSYSESEDSSKRNHRYRSSSRERSISSNDRRSRRKSFDRIYNRISRSRSRTRSRSRSKSSSRSRSRRRVDKNVSAPAVEERRIVYVGRIEQETTKEILRQKFIPYGPIKNITIHYKDTGMKYGFVTFEKSEDAFRVIDSGSKDDTINNYDISFGGRRAFCRTSYADLDSAGTNMYYAEYPPRQMTHQTEDDSFEALLSKMKAKLNATKSKVKA